jgi:hypothetical protein
MQNIKEALLAIPKNSIIRITDKDGESEDTLFFGLSAVDDQACLIEGIDMDNGINSVEIVMFDEDEEIIENIEIVKTLDNRELAIEVQKLQELSRSILEEENQLPI